jgi:hypothetical protein
VIVA